MCLAAAAGHGGHAPSPYTAISAAITSRLPVTKGGTAIREDKAVHLPYRVLPRSGVAPQDVTRAVPVEVAAHGRDLAANLSGLVGGRIGCLRATGRSTIIRTNSIRRATAVV